MRLKIPVALMLIGLSACSYPLCTNEIVKSLRSPDGNHEAVMFMRECGATTDFTTQVSVDPWFFQSIGNTFVADGYNGGTHGPWGGPWAEIVWTAPDRLLVTYDEQARVFDRKLVVRGVTITYRRVHR